DRWDGGCIALADTEVAAPIGLLEAVVPVIVIADGDVAETIDLSGDVVVDEQGTAMPADLARIDLGIDSCLEVALPAHSFGAAEHDNLARRMPWPFERVAVVRHAKVIDLAALGQRQRRLDGFGRDGIERPDFVILAPDPAPAFAFDPPLDGG